MRPCWGDGVGKLADEGIKPFRGQDAVIQRCRTMFPLCLMCRLLRVARLMRQDGLREIPAPTRWKWRSAGTRPVGITNPLARDFPAQAPNAKWVTDITYIPTQEGWLSLGVVLDVLSRQVIGWSMQFLWGRDLIIQAVPMAVWQRRSPETVILHLPPDTYRDNYRFADLVFCDEANTPAKKDVLAV